mgnify:CR=1 FL=1
MTIPSGLHPIQLEDYYSAGPQVAGGSFVWGPGSVAGTAAEDMRSAYNYASNMQPSGGVDDLSSALGGQHFTKGV